VVAVKYTTIRVSLDDKKRLERIAKLLKCRSLTEALRYALKAAEHELEKGKADVNVILSSLKYAKDVGRTRAEDVDKYLYGGEQG